MKALLKKDGYFLLDLKPQLVILIFCAVFSLILARKNPNFSAGFIDSYMIIICSIVAVSTITYDEENNAMAFLMTMAISRKTYVSSKYILALIVAIAGGIGVTLLYFAIQIVAGQAPYPLTEDAHITTSQFIAKLVMVHIGSTCLSLMFNSVSIPSFFKYGSKKGLWISSLGFLIIGGIVFLLGMLLIKLGFDIDAIISSPNPGDIAGMAGLGVVVAAICLLFSYSLSQKIIGAKEF